MQYVDFAKKHDSSKKLSQIYASALALHPRHPGLWVSAADWEYFQCGNVKAARALMQSGIRVNGRSSELYLQYFTMEVSTQQPFHTDALPCYRDEHPTP